MQPTFREIKATAKASLKQHWSEAIAVSLVYLATTLLNTFTQSILMTILKVDQIWSPLAPTGVPISLNQLAGMGITVFSAIFSLCVTFPLIFGVMRWFWQLTGGQNPKVNEIFYFFSSSKIFFKILRLSITLYLLLVLGAVICFLPFVIIKLVTTPTLYDTLNIPMPMVMENLTTLTVFFELFGFLAFLMWISQYILCFTLVFSEPEFNVRQIISHTKKAVNGHKINLVCFGFSFFGWFMLSFLMLPIAFTLPFFLASSAIFGREIIRTYNRKLESVSEI